MNELMLVLAPFSMFLLWAGGLVAFPVIKRKLTLAYHAATNGEKAPDYNIMQMVITSLHEFPDDWKINGSGAQFPKTGSYRIAVDRTHGNMTVMIDGDAGGGQSTRVSPYFEHQLNNLFEETIQTSRKAIIERTLFPNGMPLLLENKS